MRLIDSDALLELYADTEQINFAVYNVPVPVVRQNILDMPTIEAEPVRHGRWVIEKRHTVSRNPYMDDNYFASATCSECDFCIHAETKSFGYPDLDTTNYCPNCGAKMQGVE